MSIELTVGMATFNDFHGVYFTIQALRMYQDLKNVEILIVDNYGCKHTKDIANKTGSRYLLFKEAGGTAAPRDLVFKEASGRAVLCLDCHVLLLPRAIERLKRYYRWRPDCNDLLQGPLIYDDLNGSATHFDPVWRSQMWGVWASDKRGCGTEPFDIPMQGLGLFSCRKTAWLGFNPKFRGFGGEEGYIHEKFRQAGHRCLCLPWLGWVHRFGRVHGQDNSYRLTVDDKVRNYVIGHSELNLPLEPIIEHFSTQLDRRKVLQIVADVTGRIIADRPVPTP